MTDPLSILRQYTVQHKLRNIKRIDDLIVFGEQAYPKSVKTSYVKYGTGRDQCPKEYYTLDCLVFFLENESFQHPVYVRNAAQKDIPAVSRPDRRDLLAYLKGEQETSENVDKSAPVELPQQIKRLAEHDRDASKKLRTVIEPNSARDSRLSNLLDAGKKQSAVPTSLRDLDPNLTVDKISEIKRKMKSRQRTQIKPLEDEIPSDRKYPDLQTDITNITSHERTWKTRTSVLEASTKKFAEGIFKILHVVKAREDGHPVTLANESRKVEVSRPSTVRGQAQPGYSRYDQERFRKEEETAEFNIDTGMTFHGTTLKSITEGVKPKPQMSSQSSRNQHQQPSHHSEPSVSVNRQPSNKRTSKVPIIVIPADTQSLISMYNARDILQDLKYVSNEDKKAQGTSRENEVLFHRQKEGGVTVPYRVVDNPLRLSPEEWDRVVAVFVQGRAWQFKGWPWNGNPVEIFTHLAAFHLKWEEITTDGNVGKWNVNILNLSRNKRHLDRASLLRFWGLLDRFMMKNKPNLRF